MGSTIPFSLHFYGDVRVALAVNIVLALMAWKLGWITRGGLAALLPIGVVVFVAFGAQGFGLLIATVALMELFVRLTTKVLIKKKRGISERKTAPLNFTSIFLPGLIPFSVGVVLTVSSNPDTQFLCLMAFLASMAAMLGDVASTEFGQAYGQRTYQLITLERVRPGTRGGVSVEGSLYGAVTVVLFVIAVLVVYWFGQFRIRLHEVDLKAGLILLLAALLANHIESVISGVIAQYERRPNKQLLQFVGAMLGALLALFFTNLPPG